MDTSRGTGLGLSTLEDICELILQSHDLDQTLANIVHLVATRMETEVCSIYLIEGTELRLRATQGLSQQSIGRSLGMGEGLIGYTAQSRKIQNVPEPQKHPRFRYFAESNEEQYHSFLGLPLYDRQQMTGVMAIQTVERRDFSEVEVSALTTIAFQLSTVIANARLLASIDGQNLQDRKPAGIEESPRDPVPILRGDAVTKGVAIAPAHVIDEAFGVAEIIVEDECKDVSIESANLQEALEKAQVETLCLEKRVAQRLSSNDAAIFHSHLMILQDQSFLDKLQGLVSQGRSAMYAVKAVVGEYVEAFRRMDDPYLRERSIDIEDIGRRILSNLCGLEAPSIRLTHPGIVVARELLPSQIASLEFDKVLGVVLESAQSNGHAAIVAKSMGIPTLLGVHGALTQIEPGAPLILDANSGCLFVEPDEQVKLEYQRLVSDDRLKQERLKRFKDRDAQTTDGTRVVLRANIGLLSDVEVALRHGADGVGLYRTEFPFMVRSSFPDRNEQYQLYRRVVERFEGRHVTFRTLDIGGDKTLPYFKPPTEENPSLGWRSVRVSLDHRDMFRTQIEAILMAARHGSVKLMFPMITNMGELHGCREVVQEARRNLKSEAIDVPEVPTGVMIEVPAAVSIAHHMAAEADFFSLGTNDLVQYMLAADRGNSMVHRYYDPLHPAVLQVIREMVEVARRCDRPLSICGEMASDPACFALLVGLGLREFSVTAPAVLGLKAQLDQMAIDELTLLADRALMEPDAEGVRRLVSIEKRNEA